MESVMHLFVGYAMLAQSISAMAQTQPSSRPDPAAVQERLVAADANQDGLISRSEADTSLPRNAKHFDRLDADDDGQLSGAELKAIAERASRMRR
jgi:Ca2+-binding EF-hand superfamily protein